MVSGVERILLVEKERAVGIALAKIVVIQIIYIVSLNDGIADVFASGQPADDIRVFLVERVKIAVPFQGLGEN